MINKINPKYNLILFMMLFMFSILFIIYIFINNYQKSIVEQNAISQINIVTKSMNNDLSKAIFRPNADTFSDINYRLKGFKNINGLVLCDTKENIVLKYEDTNILESLKVNIAENKIIFTSYNLLVFKDIIVDDYKAGVILVNISLDEYKQNQKSIKYFLLTLLFLSFIIIILLSNFIHNKYMKLIPSDEINEDISK